MANRLASFTIDGKGDGENYVIRIASDAGETLELHATYDQVDLISETIDQKLNEDEELAMKVEGR